MRKEDGLFLHYSQEQAMLAECHPLQVVREGTELLRHLKPVIGEKTFETSYVDTRDWIIQRAFEGVLTSYFVVWGLTGSSKLITLSNISLLFQNDPVVNKKLADQGMVLRQVCTHLSSSAQVAKARGLIDPSRGHGQYINSEYRSSSIVHTQYTIGEENNYEDPTVVMIEPSGPTIDFDQYGKIIRGGTDRAATTVKLLGEKFREDTKILVVIRGPGLVDRILAFREALLDSDWQNMPDVVEAAHLKFAREGKVINLRELGKAPLQQIKDLLADSMAPPEGVKRSNDQTRRIMLEGYNTESEEKFWPPYLRNLGFPDFTMVRNAVSDECFTLNLDLLEKYDPMLPEINAGKELIRLKEQVARMHMELELLRSQSFAARLRTLQGRVLNLFHSSVA